MGGKVSKTSPSPPSGDAQKEEETRDSVLAVQTGRGDNKRLLDLLIEDKRREVEREDMKLDRDRHFNKSFLPIKLAYHFFNHILEFFENTGRFQISEKHKKKFHPFHLTIVGAASKICFAAILVALTLTGFKDDQQTKYISLDSTTTETSPSASYRKCLTVPYAINNVFNVDSNGVWSGKSTYLPGKSVMKFTLKSFEKSLENYKTFMTEIKNTISNEVANGGVAKGSKNRNPMLNLVYLMSWTYPKTDIRDDGSVTTQQVSFKGDPAYVFDRLYKTAVIGSADRQCFSTPDVSFIRPWGQMTITYDYGTPTTITPAQPGSGFMGSSDSKNPLGCCPTFTDSTSVDNSKCIIPPTDYGYARSVDAKRFDLKYNIWTLTTSFALNQGIASYGILSVVQTDLTKSPVGCYSLNSACSSASTDTKCASSSYSLLFEGTVGNGKCSITVSSTKYYIEARMDTRYPGMEPVYCLVKELNSASVSFQPKGCFVRVGSTFTFPFMNHMGVSAASGDYFNYRSWCQCAAPSFDSLPAGNIKTFYTSNNFFGSSTFGNTDGYCNMFDLLHGLVLIKGNDYDNVLGQWIETVFSKYTPEQMNLMATLSGWGSLRLGGNSGAQIQRKMTGSLTTTNQLATTLFFDSCSSDQEIYDSGGLVGKYIFMNGGVGNIFGLNNKITAAKIRTPSSTCTTALTCTLSTCRQFELQISQGISTTYTYSTNEVVAINTFSIGQTQPSDALTALGVVGDKGGGQQSLAAITNAFSWCTPIAAGAGCAVIAVNTVDTLDQRINEEGGVASFSSCRDQFSLDDSAWDSTTTGISVVPPTSLFNNYYECYNTVSRSILIAFGAGSGSAGSITPLFVSFIVMIVAFRAKQRMMG